MTVYNKKKSGNLPLRIIYLEGANLFLILLVGLSISISSCNQSSVIGLSVQPANDLLNVAYIDTTTILTKTVRSDSLRTDEMLLYTANALLGKYQDPVFGTSTASLYTQLGLSSFLPSFGTSPQIDSVVLCLVYDTTYYGKRKRVAQKISVFEVTDDFNSTISYYSNNSLGINPVYLVNNYGFTPAPKDSISDTVKLKPQLRIPLANSFGADILTHQADLATNLTFQTYMKGIFITTENTIGLGVGNGNILHFLLADVQSKLALYYHNDLYHSLHYDLILGSVARFSHFNHDYSTVDANLAAQLSTTPPKQNDVTFVQSMAGLKTKIEFPYLLNWVKSGAIAVNKAELVIKVDIGATYQLDTFSAPTQLILFGIHDDGTEYVLPDYSEGTAYFGGIYNSIAHEYRFNIARYVQQVLTGKLHNNGIHLVASSGALNASRVVIGGGGIGSPYRMKLNITYTKLGRTMKIKTPEVETVRKTENKQHIINNK